jgi:hypothetical protein
VMIYNAHGLSIGYEWLLHAVQRSFSLKSPRNRSLSQREPGHETLQPTGGPHCLRIFECHIRTVVDSEIR